MLAELNDTRRDFERTGTRYHELALQRWLYDNFFVTEGYPVPVVFAAPMDAFGLFTELWGRENNPFSYLLDAKDSDGTPLYQPHPIPPKYPLFSVMRRGWRIRTEQNYSYHRWRHLSWPTIVTSGTILREHLATVATAYMPMAWDFRFQLEFMCLRPDTMAIFTKHLMRKLYRTGGQLPQTWLAVNYPYYGTMLVRMYLEGDLGYVSPDEPAPDSNVEYRVSANIVVEGWEPDIDIQLLPALWQLVFKADAVVSPGVLEEIYSQTTDLRGGDTNAVMNERTDLPPLK